MAAEISAPMSNSLLCFTLVACVAIYLVNVLVLLKEFTVSTSKWMPVPLQGHKTVEEYRKMQDYWRQKGLYKIFREIFRMVAMGMMLYFRFDAWIWKITTWSFTEENEIIHALVYVALSCLSLESAEFIFPLWNFSVEDLHGFQNIPKREFLLEQFRKSGIRCLTKMFLPVGYIVVLKTAGPYAPFYVWTCVLGITIYRETKNFKWTSVPMPIAEDIGEKIQYFSKDSKYRVKYIYAVDFSTDINVQALVPGWGRSIFVSNTLIKKYENGEVEDEEIIAIIAQEYGRRRCYLEIYSNIGIAYQAFMLLETGLFLVIGILGGLDFKMQPRAIDIVMYHRIINGLRSLGDICYNFFESSFVYKGDAYAMERGRISGLHTYLTKEMLKNTHAMHAYPPYSPFRRSVPTLLERLIAIDVLDQRMMADLRRLLIELKKPKNAANVVEKYTAYRRVQFTSTSC